MTFFESNVNKDEYYCIRSQTYWSIRLKGSFLQELNTLAYYAFTCTHSKTVL